MVQKKHYYGLNEWYSELDVDPVGDQPINHFKQKTSMAKKSAVSPTLISEQPSPGSESDFLTSITTREALREAILNFKGCALKETASTTVFSDGNPKASLMVIGEAPGAEEDKQGLPFVGASGKLLDKIFAAIGLSRQEHYYITNILPWRPPGNRTPTNEEMQLFLPFVRQHIAIMNPKILVLVGSTSTKTILARSESMMRLRGQWHNYQITPAGQDRPITIPTMVTFHPSFLLRSPGQKKWAWQDFLMIRAKMRELGI